MRYCVNCGSELAEGARFCGICGNEIVSRPEMFETEEEPSLRTGEGSMDQRNMVSEMAESDGASNDVQEKLSFVDEDEYEISRLGNNWVTNIFTQGALGEVHGILTNKRVYLQGKMYSFEDKKLVSSLMDKVVNVEDVQATGFQQFRRPGLLITGIVFLIFGLLSGMGMSFFGGSGGSLMSIGLLGAVIFIVLYFMANTTVFVIEYAGGGIQFRVDLEQAKEIKKFSYQIHKMKNKVREEIR